jgi:hypothetical protein
MTKTLIIAATLVASLSAVANDHTGHEENPAKATAKATATATPEAKPAVDCKKTENKQKEECKTKKEHGKDHAAATTTPAPATHETTAPATKH